MLHTTRHQRGQSTVEFVLLSVAVVPFILALRLMAKTADIQHATAQASQYAVWERAMNPAKASAQVGNEVRARFFTRPTRSFADREMVGDTEADYRPYWSDQGNRRLLKKFSDVRQSDRHYGLQPAKQIFDLAAGIFVSSMKLNENGMWQVRIQAPLQKQPGKMLAPFDSLDIVPGASASLLTDSWAAANKAAVSKTIADWRVTTTDPIVTRAVQALAYMFNVLDLEADPGSFENKNVDHDVVPCEFRVVRGQISC